MVGRTPGVSLYHQIKTEIQDEIDALPNGARFLTEAQLSKRFGVSRGTVRQAVTDLVADGYLYRIQGSGTYKGAAKVNSSYFIGKTFTEQIEASGQEPGIANVTLDLVPADKNVAALLNIEEGRLVFRLGRIRTVDGRKVAYCCAYIRAEAMPSLRVSDLRMSFMAMISETFHLPLTNRRIRCRAAAASKEMSKKLDLLPKAPVLYMENQGDSGDFKPLFVDISHFCDTYSLEFNPDRF